MSPTLTTCLGLIALVIAARLLLLAGRRRDDQDFQSGSFDERHDWEYPGAR
jgi:hypothetical protein